MEARAFNAETLVNFGCEYKRFSICKSTKGQENLMH